tara:strand:- start:5 stop:208 length:204 start_codon:yes stop_codon:yes gene_type:complete
MWELRSQFNTLFEDGELEVFGVLCANQDQAEDLWDVWGKAKLGHPVTSTTTMWKDGELVKVAFNSRG